MVRLLPFLVFITPVLSMFSLWCLTPMLGILLAVIIISSDFKQFKFSITRLELAFISWGFLTCLCAGAPSLSIVEMTKISLIICLVKIVINNYQLTPFVTNSYLNISLIFGIVCAIFIFLIEYYSSGEITNLNQYFAFSNKGKFELYRLDGGCTFLSAISWVSVGILLKQRKYLFALIMVITIFIILLISDSLASVLAFIASALTFLIIYFFNHGARLVRYSIIVGTIGILASFSLGYQHLPKIFAEYPSMPYSWSHRLSIYSFFTEKSLENPIIGSGIRTSKNPLIRQEYYNSSQNLLLIPTPVTAANQPHNMALEIWLDTGLVGVILFLFLLNQFLRNQYHKEDIIYSASAYGCFVSYYAISSISNGAWNTSWMATAVWLCIAMQLVKRPPQRNSR